MREHLCSEVHRMPIDLLNNTHPDIIHRGNILHHKMVHTIQMHHQDRANMVVKTLTDKAILLNLSIIHNQMVLGNLSLREPKPEQPQYKKP